MHADRLKVWAAQVHEIAAAIEADCPASAEDDHTSTDSDRSLGDISNEFVAALRAAADDLESNVL